MLLLATLVAVKQSEVYCDALSKWVGTGVILSVQARMIDWVCPVLVKIRGRRWLLYSQSITDV